MTDAMSPIRALRAAAFAAVCVTLAAVGHSFTSGHEIPLGALWTAFGVTAGVAWLAGGRRRGFRSIGAGLLTVQGGLHLIFAGALPFGGAEAPSHLPHGAATGTGTGMDMGEGSGAAFSPSTPLSPSAWTARRGCSPPISSPRPSARSGWPGARPRSSGSRAPSASWPSPRSGCC